jgi:hypothetical protein
MLFFTITLSFVMYFTTWFRKWTQRITPLVSQNDSSSGDKQAYVQPQIAKYLLDPMRTTTLPDVLGEFYDPMGGHYAPSYDLTNTGA